jgi:predicted transposase/invertase (TIGR01784 family)
MTFKNKIRVCFFLVMIFSVPSHGVNRCLMGLPTVSHQWMAIPVAGSLTALQTKRFSHPTLVTKNFPSKHHTQIYGIATYDALFKYVLSQKTVQASFFRTFLPGIPIKSIERLDDHMNPLQSLQHLRSLFAGKDVAAKVSKLRKAEEKSKLTANPDATKFLSDLIGHFDDFQNLIPKQEHNDTMDFVCELDNGDYALVEMQVLPEKHWYARSLAYVAAFYGNQLRKGDNEWKNIKKVIGVNILGGGKEARQYWGNTPEQFIRHYKITEQKDTVSGFINDIELMQYHFMNPPKPFDVDVHELKDWITFFRDGSTMSEDDVRRTIKTEAVLKAFAYAKISKLPAEVQQGYHAQDKEFDQYSNHTAKEIEKGRQEGELNAKMSAARKMILNGTPNEDILDLIEGIEVEQIDMIRQTLAIEQNKKPGRDGNAKQNALSFMDESTMSENEVKRTITVGSVLEVFKRSTTSSWPKKVQEDYAAEEKKYDQYAEHVAKEIEKGRQEGQLKGKTDVARKMILKGKTNEDILEIVEGLTVDQIENLRQTIAYEKSKKRDRNGDDHPKDDRKSSQPLSKDRR